MTMLRLNKITLDGHIQPRVAISQDTINEYCQANIDGEVFPPPIVFHDVDVKKYYLADGWHRYHAALQAKMTEIDCEIKKGSLRDAIFFSLSANAKHGLNRTNSDKRRAVMVCIDDNEWQKMPARQIALTCGVSHSFVNLIYKEIAEEKKSGNVSTLKNKENGNQETAISKPPKPTVKKCIFDKPVKVTEGDGVYVVPEGMQLVDKFSYEETMQNYKETLEQNIILQKLLDSDEPLKTAAKEIDQLKAKISITESRFNGIMSEKAEAIRHVKARDAVIKKLNDQLKKLDPVKF